MAGTLFWFARFVGKARSTVTIAEGKVVQTGGGEVILNIPILVITGYGYVQKGMTRGIGLEIEKGREDRVQATPPMTSQRMQTTRQKTGFPILLEAFSESAYERFADALDEAREAIEARKRTGSKPAKPATASAKRTKEGTVACPKCKKKIRPRKQVKELRCLHCGTMIKF